MQVSLLFKGPKFRYYEKILTKYKMRFYGPGKGAINTLKLQCMTASWP